jgi:UDP-N-acetylmuramoyl-tripeptide--D-alanyl-D-alanine ligase
MNLSVLLILGLVIGCLLAGRILIHYFQLESYQFPGYFRTLRRNLLKAVLPGFCMTILLIVTTLLSVAIRPEVTWVHYAIDTAVLIAGGWFIGRSFSEKNAKKAFVLTPRVKRLYGVALVVLTLILLLVSGRIDPASGLKTTADRIGIGFMIIFPALLPLWIALSGLLAWPIEKGISELYFRDAQRILRSRKDLIRIGITGSWGKTSVKFILGTILEEKYHTLVTPASFNTPMGVTKVIRSKLEPGHRVFVAEMGARHVGDIKEMCRLVHPEIGILTSVGPQHLDTFKTLDRVIGTKYELIDALPADGRSFFADDGDICRKLYEKTAGNKTITGLDPDTDDVWAENIRYSPEGSAFDLCTAQGRIRCRSQLLGELNIRNILLCAAVAFKLGLTPEQVARGIGKIRPIEHRLQLIRNPGGMSVIDDAFNSNIRGAKQAFQVLKAFPEKRIVVTPGMVELGEKEYEMNREFGEAMADCCDAAILVGKKRSQAIGEGLRAGGFAESSIHVVSSLDEATELLRRMVTPGDTVLFENDLPDNYSE